MKVYVRGYKPKAEEEKSDEEKRHFFAPAEILVDYSDVPDDWITTLFDAEFHCQELNRSRVHVGTHYCVFSVEELSDGKSAIVCLTHPDGLAPKGNATWVI